MYLDTISVINTQKKCYSYYIVGETMNINIADRVKELRMSRGLSTNKLSTMAGLSQSYVRKLERGESKPSVESLELICEALGISLIDFLSSGQESVAQLKAINVIRTLSDERLEGFCKLMGSSEKEK